MEINTEDDYNLQLNLKLKSVKIPGVYTFWNSKFGDASDDEIKKYDEDKKGAKKKGESLEDDAKNKDNPHSEPETEH